MTASNTVSELLTESRLKASVQVEKTHETLPKSICETIEVIPIKFIIRGKSFSSNEVKFSSRDSSFTFTCPSAIKLLEKIRLKDPTSLARDFSSITAGEIIDFLVETGKALDYSRNSLMQEACALTTPFNGLTPSIIEASYRQLPAFFTEPVLRTMVENEIGSRFLDEWVEVPIPAGRAKIRAYGAKALHIIAGNVPLVAALSIIRGALTKSDNIIKLPSNDPLTATAILETMRDVDRNHPVVKHFTSVYWKGGDQKFERGVVSPHFLEKIIAWGGHNSIRHIKTLVGPGIDLITLDPKFSVSIIGEEAFRTEEDIKRVTFLAAIDSAAYNQEACVTSRTHFVKTSSEKASIYSRYLYDFMQQQDPAFSTKPKYFPRKLKDQIDSLRIIDEFYEVIGGEHGEGAVITSLAGEPVEFFPSCKTVNVIPINDYQEVVELVTVATQTVGIYPESLKDELMDILVTKGVQRFVSLGQAAGGMVGVPHDAMEPMRRACKWIVNEISTFDSNRAVQSGGSVQRRSRLR
ncbi:MAG: acyl-CoA reductase [Candidatus Odinarchaeota archaeon]